MTCGCRRGFISCTSRRHRRRFLRRARNDSCLHNNTQLGESKTDWCGCANPERASPRGQLEEVDALNSESLPVRAPPGREHRRVSATPELLAHVKHLPQAARALRDAELRRVSVDACIGVPIRGSGALGATPGGSILIGVAWRLLAGRPILRDRRALLTTRGGDALGTVAGRFPSPRRRKRSEFRIRSPAVAEGRGGAVRFPALNDTLVDGSRWRRGSYDLPGGLHF